MARAAQLLGDTCFHLEIIPRMAKQLFFLNIKGVRKGLDLKVAVK